MANRRTYSRRRGTRDVGSFWLSFSDLMSSLVLIIVLVLFYIIYQYFNLAEVKEAEIASRQQQLDAAQVELDSRERQLTLAQSALNTQQDRLNAAETQMAEQQAQLDEQETQLAAARNQIAEKEAEIESAQSQMQSQQAQLDRQQSQLDQQESQLNRQRSQLDEQEAQLAAAQSALDDKEAAYNSAQAQLLTQQAQITWAEEQLDQQQAQLAAAQSALDDKEAAYNSAQAQLLTQQTQLAQAEAQLRAQQSELETTQDLLAEQQSQIEQLVGMKPRIIASLSAAFRDAGVLATVDPSNGSIVLKSDVLFETAKYELTDRGKQFIDQLLPVYLQVLSSEEYRPYVAEIIIEGHTDSDGTWLSNLALSQQRALAVANYVLGSECRTVSNDAKDRLRKVVTVNGRSSSDRIYNANGTENKDASRRVVFKFRLTDEQMIRQLQVILESQN